MGNYRFSLRTLLTGVFWLATVALFARAAQQPCWRLDRVIGGFDWSGGVAIDDEARTLAVHDTRVRETFTYKAAAIEVPVEVCTRGYAFVNLQTGEELGYYYSPTSLQHCELSELGGRYDRHYLTPDGRELVTWTCCGPDWCILDENKIILDDLAPLLANEDPISGTFNRDGTLLAVTTRHDVRVFKRTRPEWGYGICWLGEFWLLAALTCSLLLNIQRDAERTAAKTLPRFA